MQGRNDEEGKGRKKERDLRLAFGRAEEGCLIEYYLKYRAFGKVDSFFRILFVVSI